MLKKGAVYFLKGVWENIISVLEKYFLTSTSEYI